VHPIREQREYAVLQAAQQERAAWRALEKVNRPNADARLLDAQRQRWQDAARSLAYALRALKR
jgi:hypothetical protein